MKKCYFLLLVFLSVALTGYSQKKYTKTFDITFSGGNNGGFSGSLPSENLCTISVEGWLNVEVNHTHIPMAPMYWYMANCWTKNIIFDQSNRYIEFRIKTDYEKSMVMSVNTYGGCDGCCAEDKTWPGNTFTIPEADKWTVVFLKVPPTTGGSQNVIDTVRNSLAWFFENGNYVIDYIKVGIAAIPPKPVINVLKDYFVNPEKTYNIPLNKIKIPGRFLEGLKINAEIKDNGKVIREISLLDTNDNPFILNETDTITNAILKIVVDSAIVGSTDSVFVTLADTIRNTSTTTAFKVIVVENTISLASSSAEIILYPNPTTGIVTLIGDNIIKTEVFDITGRSQGLFYGKQIDLSNLSDGIYILNVYGKEGLIKKEKIILAK